MTLEEMRRIKQERGYSLAQLSEYSGVPLGTVQKIFSGETEHPRYATLQALQRVLSRESEGYGVQGMTQKVQEAVRYEASGIKKQG